MQLDTPTQATKHLDFSPYSTDVATWSRPNFESNYITFNLGLYHATDVLREASKGTHSSFVKALDNLDPNVAADCVAVRHCLMIYAMLDDPVGAALILADMRFRKSLDRSTCTADCATYALRNDRVAYLTWALDNCTIYNDKVCCRDAGHSGTVRVLDCLGKSKVAITFCLLDEAIVKDNFSAIKWYVNGKYPVHRWACCTSLREGKLDTLKYLIGRNIHPFQIDMSQVCKYSTDMLDRLESTGVSMPPLADCGMCTSAVAFNNLEALEWCKRKGYEWNVATFVKGFDVRAPASRKIMDYLWKNNCHRPKLCVIRECSNHSLRHVAWYSAKILGC